MTYLLHCTTPTTEHRWVLRTGETARVGQSAWVEFSIDDDPSLSEEHFSISYTRELVVQSLAGSLMEIDGNTSASATLHSEAKILAGHCMFVFRQAHPSHLGMQPVAVSDFMEPTTPFVWRDKQSVMQEVGLTATASTVIAPCSTPRSAVALLQSKNLLEDAMRLLAGTLPTQAKISWCWTTLKRFGVAGTVDVQSLLAAWLTAPSEPTRSAIADLVPWTESSSPCTWLLAAIAWTGGSLGPKGTAPISPPPSMITSAIIAAMQLSCCQVNAIDLRSFSIEDGLRRLSSKDKE